jgi:NADH dehydrogenase
VGPLGATPHHRARVHRAKALAEEAVRGADLRTTTLRSSLIYAPGDRRLALLELLSLLPAVPVTATMAGARSQPVWAGDVAACVAAILDRPPGSDRESFDIAGPDTMSHRDAVALALRALGRPRRLVSVPSGLIVHALAGYEALTGPIALATRDEAEMLAATMLTPRGTADAEALGVRPRRMADVLAR